jgi:hypothetical protein
VSCGVRSQTLHRRQRHKGAGRSWVNFARQQHVEAPALPNALGNLTGFVAGAKIKVCSRRPDNRRTSVLCDHDTTKRRPIYCACERQIGLDEEWRAISMQSVVNRD